MSLFRRLKRVCDTSFLYWHRVIFPTYVANMYENAIDVYRIKVMYLSILAIRCQ